MPTFNPPIPPSVGSGSKTTFRIFEAKFGDGYGQRSRDGLNHKVEEWPLRWNALTKTELDSITGFLDEQGGDIVFEWTPPEESVARKFTCLSYQDTYLGAGNHALSATFKQVFDL